MVEPPRGRSIWCDHIIASAAHTTWPSLSPLCLRLSLVSAQGRNHVQMDKPTVRQKDYGRIDRGCRPPPLPPPLGLSIPSVHEPWKTYQSHSRMNSWIAHNYSRPDIYRKQLNLSCVINSSIMSVINSSIVKNARCFIRVAIQSGLAVNFRYEKWIAQLVNDDWTLYDNVIITSVLLSYYYIYIFWLNVYRNNSIIQYFLNKILQK